MIHADSRATNLVDQKMMYVGISRAKTSAAVYTDDRAKLVSETAVPSRWSTHFERQERWTVHLICFCGRGRDIPHLGELI
jgi:ATP-dependent exoDNAse (exonuclease V) alpha subunit